MKLLLVTAGAALVAQPVTAQHSGHHPPAEASVNAAQSADEAAVRDVLSQYKSAIERLDATGTERLFAADSSVFETGGVEGTYANYLAHHLGPELKELKSFGFSNYKADVRFEGPVALATETYNYRIETKKGEIAERLGVATSVLTKVNGSWKILSMHNSARRPKA
ncbi:MAG: nuclear transport factor 2 family protein [Pseudomonadota bacterium]